jgi:hypothetical protein
MEMTMNDIMDLIERAANDPEFLSAARPAHELNAVLGSPESSEREIVQALQARISHATHGKQ